MIFCDISSGTRGGRFRCLLEGVLPPSLLRAMIVPGVGMCHSVATAGVSAPPLLSSPSELPWALTEESPHLLIPSPNAVSSGAELGAGAAVREVRDVRALPRVLLARWERAARAGGEDGTTLVSTASCEGLDLPWVWKRKQEGGRLEQGLAPTNTTRRSVESVQTDGNREIGESLLEGTEYLSLGGQDELPGER